jgi:hypothetical protein
MVTTEISAVPSFSAANKPPVQVEMGAIPAGVGRAATLEMVATAAQ